MAREFGLNWRTVKRELESGEPRRYAERAKPTALTEAQQAHVERRLAVCPTLRGTDLYGELTKAYEYTELPGVRAAPADAAAGRGA